MFYYGKKIRFIWYIFLVICAFFGFFWGVPPSYLLESDFLNSQNSVPLRFFIIFCSCAGYFSLFGFFLSTVLELFLIYRRRSAENRRVFEEIFKNGTKTVTIKELSSLLKIEEEIVSRLLGGNTKDCSYKDYIKVKEWIKKTERQ